MTESVGEPTTVESFDRRLLQDTLAELDQRMLLLRKQPEWRPPSSRQREEKLVTAWYHRMRILVGDDLFLLQRNCGRRDTHTRGRICSDCGFSHNLYIEGLEAALRRRGRPRN